MRVGGSMMRLFILLVLVGVPVVVGADTDTDTDAARDTLAFETDWGASYILFSAAASWVGGSLRIVPAENRLCGL